MKRLALFFTVCAMSLAQSCCAGVSAQSNFDNEFVVKVDEKSTFPVEFYSTITMETSELTFSDVSLNLQNYSGVECTVEPVEMSTIVESVNLPTHRLCRGWVSSQMKTLEMKII